MSPLNIKYLKEHIVSFIVGSLIGFFVFFLIAVIKDSASCFQIIIPSFLVGIAASIWKDKFIDWFLKIASWF